MRKNFIYLLICLLMTSCIPQKMDQRMNNLEKKGIIPQLDRGPDLMGPDSNHDGVRDDVEVVIQGMPITVKQKAEAMKMAKNLQDAILIDLNNEEQVRQVSDAMFLSIVCLGNTFEHNNEESAKMVSISSKIEKITFNTKERVMAYLKYNKRMSGTVSRLPEGEECEK